MNTHPKPMYYLSHYGKEYKSFFVVIEAGEKYESTEFVYTQNIRALAMSKPLHYETYNYAGEHFGGAAHHEFVPL